MRRLITELFAPIRRLQLAFECLLWVMNVDLTRLTFFRRTPDSDQTADIARRRLRGGRKKRGGREERRAS